MHRNQHIFHPKHVKAPRQTPLRYTTHLHTEYDCAKYNFPQ